MADKTDYQLTEAEARLLQAVTEDALANAGAIGGSIGARIGGLIGGGVAAEGGESGAAGGRFGIRFTKPLTAETVLEVPHDPDTARERARSAIVTSGLEIEDPNAAHDSSVWGIVPSGARNMVPALVRVHAEPFGSGGSRVHVRATGREGLIKQRIGAKAADRIAEAISQP